jgi:hypothetical protein
MRAETEILVAECEQAGLEPERLAVDRFGAERIRITLVPGVPAVLRIARPGSDLFDAAATLSVPIAGSRRIELEKILSQLDDLILPVRVFAIGDELVASIHGSWQTADGLALLGLESARMLRRIGDAVVAPLVRFVSCDTPAEDVLRQIIEGLGTDVSKRSS